MEASDVESWVPRLGVLLEGIAVISSGKLGGALECFLNDVESD